MVLVCVCVCMCACACACACACVCVCVCVTLCQWLLAAALFHVRPISLYYCRVQWILPKIVIILLVKREQVFCFTLVCGLVVILLTVPRRFLCCSYSLCVCDFICGICGVPFCFIPHPLPCFGALWGGGCGGGALVLSGIVIISMGRRW